MDTSRTSSVSEPPLAGAIRFAALHSPYYRAQDWAAIINDGRSFAFRDIPITTASNVKSDASLFYCSYVSPNEGAVTSKHTSGSTGAPLEVRVTKRHSRMNGAENRRLCEPWGISKHRRVLHVRVPQREKPVGTIEERILSRSARGWIVYTMEPDTVADTIRRTSASFVSGLPSVLHGAIENCSHLNTLRLVGTVGEIVSDEFKRLVHGMPNCRLFDCYGCTEVGIVAAQCALCKAYHPADRHVALELINDDGFPAAAGEMGRVIVTSLCNQAMPLIRYELGDYAVRSKTNSCPEGQYSLARVVGRKKNLFTLPNGQKISPVFPAKEAHTLGIRKFKMVQLALDHIELRYIPVTDDMELQPDVVQNVIDNYMSPKIRVTPVRVHDIPRAPSGKYLMHESLVE